MFVLWCGATVISGLVRRKEMQDSQSIEDGCCYILEVVELHQRGLGIDQEPERQVGSQLVVVEQSDRLDSQGEDRFRDLGHQMGQQRLFGVPRLVFWRSLPPSCGPSTPFGFP